MQWEQLKLSEEEHDTKVVIEDALESDLIKGQRSVIGRFCANRVLGKEILCTTLEKIGRISEAATLLRLGRTRVSSPLTRRQIGSES